MTNIKAVFADVKNQRLALQEDERNLRHARLDVGLLVFPSSPRRIVFGVGVGIYVFSCFYLPSSHGRLFDGATRLLPLVTWIGAMYLVAYQAKVSALRKLIAQENPALFEKIRNTKDVDF